MSIEKKDQKQKSKLDEFSDGLKGMVFLVVLGLVGWNWLTDGEKSEAATSQEVQLLTPEEQARADAEAATIAAEKAKEKAFGFHCLSGWDGSHTKFVQALNAQLNDPDSFEHEETRTWTVGADGRNKVTMLFRAKNGFGGVIRGRAVGSFDNTTCDALVEAIE
jgi:hypothetical protein